MLAGEEEWQPLLRPSFLETLWQKLAGLWQELGFQPEEGSASPSQALVTYAQSGSYTQSDSRNSGQSIQLTMCHEVLGFHTPGKAACATQQRLCIDILVLYIVL